MKEPYKIVIARTQSKLVKKQSNLSCVLIFVHQPQHHAKGRLSAQSILGLQV